MRDAGIDSVTGYAYTVTDEIASDILVGWGSNLSPTRFTNSEFNTAGWCRESGATEPPLEQPDRAQPGAFTREFMSLGTPAPARSEPRKDEFAAAAKPGGGPGAFTRMFFARPGAAPLVTEPALPEVGRQVKQPSQAGAFTRMFGQPATRSATAPQAGVPGAFTRMFQTSAGAKADHTTPTAPPLRPGPATGAFSSLHPEPAVGRAPTSPVAPAAGGAPRAPATRFFSANLPRGQMPTVPAGPSEYTKVISSSPFAEPCPIPPPSPAPGAPPPVAPVLGGGTPAPAAPQVQGYPAGSAHAAPPPPAPPMAAPQVPQPPAAPQPNAVSSLHPWMPLIILLNVLFLIAILLIVVFALKGH